MNATPKAQKRPKLTPEQRQLAAAEKMRLAEGKKQLAEEKKRQAAAERERLAAERKRLAEEKKGRAAAEKERLAAEKKRLAEEKKRQAAAERERMAAERERQAAAEKLRLAQEKERLAAEKRREAQRRARSPEVFSMALDAAVAPDNQLVTAAELARRVKSAEKSEFLRFWSEESSVVALPTGVGSLRVKSGRKNVRKFFRLNDVEPGVGKLTESGGPPRRGALKERLLAEFDRLNRQAGERFYVTLYDLRSALDGVGRGDFDAALNELRKDWVLTLNPAEGRHEQIPAHVLDAGIPEQSKVLVYVSRREA